MRKTKREDRIYRRAYELADSGLHIDCITIVSALIDEGYPEARDILENDIVRADLRAVCAKHWQASEADDLRSPADNGSADTLRGDAPRSK